MLSYWLECRKKESKIPGLLRQIKECVFCDSKKPSFIKKQEAIGLVSNLGIRIPFSKFQC